MTSSVTTSIPQSVLDQIHWDSIVDVCTGKAKNLTEAKAKRTSELKNYARIKKMGIHDNLTGLYLSDPTLLDLTECIMSGGKWGDIWYTSTHAELRAIEAELTALHASTDSGRWRRAAPLYTQRDRLRKELGLGLD
jgi:hypothetical protein